MIRSPWPVGRVPAYGTQAGTTSLISVEAMSDPLVTNDRRTGVPELAPPVVREK